VFIKPLKGRYLGKEKKDNCSKQATNRKEYIKVRLGERLQREIL
jgi:hypothetical protein